MSLPPTLTVPSLGEILDAAAAQQRAGLVGGGQGSGKSAVLAVALNRYVRAGRRVLLFSPDGGLALADRACVSIEELAITCRMGADAAALATIIDNVGVDAVIVEDADALTMSNSALARARMLKELRAAACAHNAFVLVERHAPDHEREPFTASELALADLALQCLGAAPAGGDLRVSVRKSTLAPAD